MKTKKQYSDKEKLEYYQEISSYLQMKVGEMRLEETKLIRKTLRANKRIAELKWKIEQESKNDNFGFEKYGED